MEDIMASKLSATLVFWYPLVYSSSLDFATVEETNAFRFLSDEPPPPPPPTHEFDLRFWPGVFLTPLDLPPSTVALC